MMASTSLQWYVVCSVLENLPNEKRPQRRERLKRLFADHRRLDPDIKAGVATGKHMYSLMRLLLPQMDRDEGGKNVLYHLKEQGVAKLFVQALGLDGTESARKLTKWKQPEVDCFPRPHTHTPNYACTHTVCLMCTD